MTFGAVCQLGTHDADTFRGLDADFHSAATHFRDGDDDVRPIATCSPGFLLKTSISLLLEAGYGSQRPKNVPPSFSACVPRLSVGERLAAKARFLAFLGWQAARPLPTQGTLEPKRSAGVCVSVHREVRPAHDGVDVSSVGKGLLSSACRARSAPSREPG